MNAANHLAEMRVKMYAQKEIKFIILLYHTFKNSPRQNLIPQTHKHEANKLTSVAFFAYGTVELRKNIILIKSGKCEHNYTI